MTVRPTTARAGGDDVLLQSGAWMRADGVAPIRWTPEQSLAAMIGDQSPEDVIVYASEGNEIPTEEVKKTLKRGRRK